MAGAHRAGVVGPEWIHLREHVAALRQADQRFAEERDRRYTETNIEREKALKIKEQADRDALALARADQTYKDERANNLRTQLERERGDYATKDDLAALADKIETTMRPVLQYMASTSGSRLGSSEARTEVRAERNEGRLNINTGLAVLGAAIALLGLILALKL
jgi:hypothetical protein